MLVETNIYDNDYQLQFLFERCNGGVDMENVIRSNIVLSSGEMMERCGSEVRNLAKAQTNREYMIREVKTNDEELKKFLFSLGCYKGETITVLSVLGENYVISIKDARYSVDKDLAEAIIV
jgi:ferrous iron transport protein A